MMTDTALPNGWARKGELIVVCSWCVAEGAVQAPPEATRTDTICPAHAEQLRARLRGTDGKATV